MAQEESGPPKPKPKIKPMSETRKIRKPLMERKRRERINSSLNELARLLTEAQKVKSDGGKTSKLEKADILELTVQHLQSLHKYQDPTKEKSPVLDDEKYYDGFRECIRIVEKALKESTTEELKERLLTHLYGRLRALRTTPKRPTKGVEKRQEEKENRLEEDASQKTKAKSCSTDKCSFTLVPTELPDGGVAFVLTGNPQKLLKEWENLSVEARISTPKEIETSPAVSTTAKTSQSFEDSPSCLASPGVTTHNVNILNKTNNPLQCIPSSSSSTSPSISNLQISSEVGGKTYHTLQPLNPHISHTTSSAASLSRLRLQGGKPHCPPTPPPSPPTGSGYKPQLGVPLYQPPVGAERRALEEMDVDRAMNEPFDLRVSRMWRPW